LGRGGGGKEQEKKKKEHGPGSQKGKEMFLTENEEKRKKSSPSILTKKVGTKKTQRKNPQEAGRSKKPGKRGDAGGEKISSGETKKKRRA